MRSMPVIFTVLVGCNADLAPAVGWIAPFDGQTAVATSESLVLSMSGLKVPVDYPLNELVQVADLDRGGLVNGRITLADDVIRFQPDNGWRTDGRYAWTVRDPADYPHGPEFNLPANTAGTAVFESSDRIDALNATLGEQADRICLLLSRPSEIALTAQVSFEGQPSGVIPVEVGSVAGDYPTSPADLGAGSGCFDSPDTANLVAGAVARVTLTDSAEGADLGQWRLTLEEGALVDILNTRRRGTFTAAQWGTP